LAQTQLEGKGRFSIGIDAGLPIGHTKDVYGSSIGGSFKYDFYVANNAAFTASIGYIIFNMKSNLKSLGYTSQSFIPFKVGVKYHFVKGFYSEGQIGVSIFKDLADQIDAAFAFAGGLGYNFGSVDAGIRYEGWAHDAIINQVAARLAYSF